MPIALRRNKTPRKNVKFQEIKQDYPKNKPRNKLKKQDKQNKQKQKKPNKQKEQPQRQLGNLSELQKRQTNKNYKPLRSQLGKKLELQDKLPIEPLEKKYNWKIKQNARRLPLIGMRESSLR